MPPSFEYVFPAIRGLQAGRAYYTSMCPLRLIPKIFLFDEEEIPPELRAQRTLNKGRLPEMSRYLLENRENYVFSAITASVDAEISFKATSEDEGLQDIGLLHIPMTARFLINDGQHRRAAIEQALRECPELGDETIAVVFFLDPGLDRCQQMFTDLNRYAVRPSPSLSLLYDHRDLKALVAKEVVRQSKVFTAMVEFEKSNLAPRSGKLFTLSAIATASRVLLSEHQDKPIEEQGRIAATYWDAVAEHMPAWRQVKARQLSAGEFRRDFVNAHGLALSALARAGRALMLADPDSWQARLDGLATIDWSRSNTDLGEGRAFVQGRISKAHAQVALTTNIIKLALDLELSPDELRAEQSFLKTQQPAA